MKAYYQIYHNGYSVNGGTFEIESSVRVNALFIEIPNLGLAFRTPNGSHTRLLSSRDCVTVELETQTDYDGGAKYNLSINEHSTNLFRYVGDRYPIADFPEYDEVSDLIRAGVVRNGKLNELYIHNHDTAIDCDRI